MNRAAEYKGFERRHYPRIPVKWKLKYKVIGREPKLEEETITKDVSVSGVLFETDKPMPMATLLEIELSIETPGNHPEPIKATAEVSRQYKLAGTKRYNIGLRFIKIDDADIKKISGYIKSK